MLILVGVGLALGGVAALLTLGLVAAGMVSSSVAIGVWRGKAQAGLRAFFLQCGIAAGIPAGMLCAWVGTQLWSQVDAGTIRVLIAGGLGGALSGLLVALLFDFIARRVQTWLAARSERA